MNIQNKIEEIRKKPEHIRLRWVMGLTAVCAFFIIILWIFSIRIQTGKNNEKALTSEQQVFIEEFYQQKKSIEDATGQIKNAYDSSVESEATEEFNQ